MRVPYCDQCGKKIYDVSPGTIVSAPWTVRKGSNVEQEFCSAKCAISHINGEFPTGSYPWDMEAVYAH